MQRTLQYFRGLGESLSHPMSNNQTAADMRSSQTSDASDGSSSNLRTRKNNGERPSFHKSQAMVTVNVNEKVFVVHLNFICHYSPYFHAAFNGNFKEAVTHALDLENTDPAVFELFVNWIYTQNIRESNDETPPVGDLIALWLLAEKLLAPRLQN